MTNYINIISLFFAGISTFNMLRAILLKSMDQPDNAFNALSISCGMMLISLFLHLIGV